MASAIVSRGANTLLGINLLSSRLSGMPPATAEQLALSARLSASIQQALAPRGWLGFDRYMQQALYHPRFGYYQATASQFGEGGDYITAPGLGEAFAVCVARQCAEIFQHLPVADILEFGAGDGALAVEVLRWLERAQALPQRYQIIEVSAALRQRQRQHLAAQVPHLLSKVVWLARLPAAGFCGVIIANEVLDAMPVKRFYIGADAQAYDLGVTFAAGRFCWHRSDTRLGAALQPRLSAFGLPPGYRSEIGLQAEAWVESVAACLQHGALLLIDYGLPANEYYHVDRHDGTLRCHYRHRVHSDPFVYIGLQDLTAQVNFSAVAASAARAGLKVHYTSQAAFLLGCGALQWLAEALQDAAVTAPRRLALTQQVKKLTLPHEMGELYKVMLLTRNVDQPLSGFSVQDRTARL